MTKKLLLVTIALSLTACSLGPARPKVKELVDVSVLTTHADQQTTVVKAHQNPSRVCGARVADVADTKSMSLGLSGEGDSLKEGATQGALSLGGMSPAVLIVSELMYRACELSMNGNLSKEEAIAVYDTFLDAAIQISIGQSGSGAASEAALPTAN